MTAIIQRAAAAEAQPESARTIVVTASDDSVDRYGDRILVDGTFGGRRYGEGWQLDAFMRNPVVLFGHAYNELPIGTVAKLWRDQEGQRKRLRARIVFAAGNPVAGVVLDLYREGVLRAVSVGFKSVTRHEPADEEEREALGLGPRGVIHATSELWEISAVPVPANPGALVEGLRCDRRTGLCHLAKVAAAQGHRHAALAIRSALAPRRTLDRGRRGDRLDELAALTAATRAALRRPADAERVGCGRLVRSAEEALRAVEAALGRR